MDRAAPAQSIVDDPEGDLSPPGTARGGRAAARATDKRKDRSLGVLTRKFVRELLRGGSVSLDAFNEKLERLRLSIDPDASQCKTQVRASQCDTQVIPRPVGGTSRPTRSDAGVGAVPAPFHHCPRNPPPLAGPPPVRHRQRPRRPQAGGQVPGAG